MLRKNTFRFPLCCSKAKHCRNAIERVLGQKKLLKLSIKCPVLLNDLVGIFPKSLLNDQVHLRTNRSNCFTSGLPMPIFGLYLTIWSRYLEKVSIKRLVLYFFWKPGMTRSYSRELRVWTKSKIFKGSYKWLVSPYFLLAVFVVRNFQLALKLIFEDRWQYL